MLFFTSNLHQYTIITPRAIHQHSQAFDHTMAGTDKEPASTIIPPQGQDPTLLKNPSLLLQGHERLNPSYSVTINDVLPVPTEKESSDVGLSTLVTLFWCGWYQWNTNCLQIFLVHVFLRTDLRYSWCSCP